MVSPGGKVYADELDALIDRRVCRVRQATAQTLADNTHTALTFGAGSDEIDTHGMHNEASNPSRITVDKDGFYQISGAVMMSILSTTVIVTAYFRINGTTGLATAGRHALSGQAFGITPSTATVALVAGDYVELVAAQDSAGADDTNSSLYLASTLEVKYDRAPL